MTNRLLTDPVGPTVPVRGGGQLADKQTHTHIALCAHQCQHTNQVRADICSHGGLLDVTHVSKALVAKAIRSKRGWKPPGKPFQQRNSHHLVQSNHNVSQSMWCHRHTSTERERERHKQNTHIHTDKCAPRFRRML